MAITPLHVQDHCLAGNTCKYICWEILEDKSVPICLKLSQSYYEKLKESLKPYDIDLEDRSDNCQGYLPLKYKPQGYDVE